MELNLRRTLDAGLIAELNKEVQDLHVAEHPDVFKPYIKKDIESFFSSLITQSDMIFEVMYCDNIPAGYVVYKIDEKPKNPFKYREKVLFIDQICILSDQQGQGFGQFIMERLEKKAKELDCHSIELDYWISNTKAQRFYQSAGFQTSWSRCVKYIKSE